MDPIPLPAPPLEDEEIVLTPYSDVDLGRLARLGYDRRAARELLFGQDERREREGSLELAVRDRGSLLLVGCAALRASGDANFDVGCWVDPREDERELATRAIGLLAEWALEHLEARRL